MHRVPALGPQATRIYASLRAAIATGTLAADVQLASQSEMAAQFGVALATLRQALVRLEEEGLIRSEQGRGTFVLPPHGPAILLMMPEGTTANLLAHHIGSHHGRIVRSQYPHEALARLAENEIVLLLVDFDTMPAAASARFLRAVQARRVDLPVMAIVSDRGAPPTIPEAAVAPLVLLKTPIEVDRLDRLLYFLLPPPLSPQDFQSWGAERSA